MTVQLEEERTNALTKSSKGYKVIIATPGQGSSGYYSEELLRTYAESTWPAGTHSYLNHTKTRDPEKMIGVFTEDAHYEDNVGVVSYLKPFSHWEKFVAEVAPYTGMSMAVSGDGRKDTVDGKETLVVESLIPSVTNTVDLVSYAGRGGKIVESLLQEALNTEPLLETTTGKPKGNENMALEDEVVKLLSVVEALITTTESAKAALAEATTKANDSIVDAAKAVDAAVVVESAEIPQSRKDKLVEGIKAGKLDVQDSIDEIVALREEILAETQTKLEESGVTFNSDKTVVVDNSVKGWN